MSAASSISGGKGSEERSQDDEAEGQLQSRVEQHHPGTGVEQAELAHDEEDRCRHADQRCGEREREREVERVAPAEGVAGQRVGREEGGPDGAYGAADGVAERGEHVVVQVDLGEGIDVAGNRDRVRRERDTVVDLPRGLERRHHDPQRREQRDRDGNSEEPVDQHSAGQPHPPHGRAGDGLGGTRTQHGHWSSPIRNARRMVTMRTAPMTRMTLPTAFARPQSPSR